MEMKAEAVSVAQSGSRGLTVDMNALTTQIIYLFFVHGVLKILLCDTLATIVTLNCAYKKFFMRYKAGNATNLSSKWRISQIDL